MVALLAAILDGGGRFASFGLGHFFPRPVVPGWRGCVRIYGASLKRTAEMTIRGNGRLSNVGYHRKPSTHVSGTIRPATGILENCRII